MLVSMGYCNKYHSLGDLNERHLFLPVSETGKSKIKVPGDVVPGEGPPPGDGQLFAVSSHGRESMLVSCLHIRTLVSTWGVYLHASSQPNHPHCTTNTMISALMVSSNSASRLTSCAYRHFSIPLSMGILQARILEGSPCPPPEGVPNPGIEPRSPALQADSLLFEPLGKPKFTCCCCCC